MGYFVAYRHTGADPKVLENMLPAVRDAFNANGQEIYCTYFDKSAFQDKGHSPAQIMEHAFEKIESMGNLFVILDGNEKSEGMLLEVGFCIAKGIPFTVAKRKGVSTYLDQMTEKTFEYENTQDLVSKIVEVI